MFLSLGGLLAEEQEEFGVIIYSPFTNGQIQGFWVEEGASRQHLVASRRGRPNTSATETRPPVFNGSWTSRGNHLGGYPVPCGWAVPSASGFRGKDHVSHTQPEPSGVNKTIRSSSPKCFGLTHQNFQNSGTMERIPVSTRLERGNQPTQSNTGVDDTELLRNHLLNIRFYYVFKNCLIFWIHCNATACKNICFICWFNFFELFFPFCLNNFWKDIVFAALHPKYLCDFK